MIGVGNRGASNLAALKSEEPVALCDVDRRYLDRMASREPSAKVFTDFRELLQLPDLDGVVVSTPDHTHYHAAALAMQSGLHVYCEKPLAHSLWEVHQLAASAQRFGVVTQTGNQHHRSRGYRQVVQLIRSGAIGPVREVYSWTNRPIWPQGIGRPGERQEVPRELSWDLWLGPAPARPYHEVYHPRGWRGWWDFGCGALGDMGPHLLDPVLHALQLSPPAWSEAETGPANDETFPASSTVRFRFPERDSQPAVDLTWYDGDRYPPESVTQVRRPPANGVLFLGERARLFAPDYGGRPIVMPHDKRDKIPLPQLDPPELPGHHDQWVQACKGGPATSCDFAYGARLTEICLLGNLAVRTGRRITPESAAASPYFRRDDRQGW